MAYYGKRCARCGAIWHEEFVCIVPPKPVTIQEIQAYYRWATYMGLEPM